MNRTVDPRYLEALTRSAQVPVIMQLDVCTVFQLVSMLQLAIKHPAVRSADNAAQAARDFIENFKEQLSEREPLLVELVELGDHPENDE